MFRMIVHLIRSRSADKPGSPSAGLVTDSRQLVTVFHYTALLPKQKARFS